MLELTNAILVCIDIQGNLAQAMHNRERLFENLRRLLSGMRVLAVPVIWTEQNPEKLGPTLPQIAQCMPAGLRPLSKMSFSCCGCEAFMRELAAGKRSDVLLAGIETHICVYQTAVDLMARGYRVHIVADCVASRTPDNRDIGMEKMRAAGACATSAETALFELLRTAASPLFKQIAGIVK